MTTLVKASYHTRSISLPKGEHPVTTNFEKQLCRLRSSSQATTSSVYQRLSDLKELYDHVDNVLQLPLTQQALFHEKNNKMMENALDGSLKLLDICGITKDVFSQMKECLQELESSLRRRRGGPTCFASEVGAYMMSRKKLNKMIVKCFDDLKKMQQACTSTPVHNESVLNMLKEVEQINLDVFESLLGVIHQAKGKLTPKSWMTMLLPLKNSSGKSDGNGNEIKNLDSELVLLCRSSKVIDVAQTQYLLKGMQTLELSIQELEEELECVYRRLMKTRVSLLNILTH